MEDWRSAAVFAQWLKLSNEPHGPWRERAQASFTSPIQDPEKIKHSRWVDKQMGPGEILPVKNWKGGGWKRDINFFHSSLAVCPKTDMAVSGLTERIRSELQKRFDLLRPLRFHWRGGEKLLSLITVFGQLARSTPLHYPQSLLSTFIPLFSLPFFPCVLWGFS